MKKIGAAGLGLCIMALLAMGCGTVKNTEPPEDTPWNHGYNAIMETDDGYYFNRSEETFYNFKMSSELDGMMIIYYAQGQYLKYWEKDSGVSILLCNKPECQHLGEENCEATYRNIMTVNTQLYEGSLYILGMDQVENTVSINLYRAALDGSAIDKVGTVIEGENMNGESISNPSSTDGFIIHKGYAYIPYYLRFGQASKTFMGGGLAKMNLKNGECQTIYECKTVSSGFPCVDAGVGDYVYFHSNKLQVYKGYRYVISEDRVEETKGFIQLEGEEEKKEFSVNWSAFSKDRNYSIGFTMKDDKESNLVFCAHDAQTGERLIDEDICTDISDDIMNAAYEDTHLVCYEDKLMYSYGDTVYWYGRDGKKLARIKAPVLKKRHLHDLRNDDYQFKINNDKLYAICKTSETGQNPRSYSVFSIPLEELFDGKTKWTEAFEMNFLDEFDLDLGE